MNDHPGLPSDPGADRPGSPSDPQGPRQGPPDAPAWSGGSVIDRRLGLDRRQVAGDETALERRRGAGRRRSDFLKSADEGELTKEQFMFLMAIESFKKANQRMFPTWTDVLEVIRLLGYRKTMPSEFRLSSAEDWREAADAPSNVRTIDGKPVRRAA